MTATPLHTVSLSHTPTSITITLDSPRMVIEVRAVKKGKRYHVQVHRSGASGQVLQAGAFSSWPDEAAAMEVALDVAHLLAVGLGVAALRGDVATATKLVGETTTPRTFELVDQALKVCTEVGKLFGKETPETVYEASKPQV